MNNKYLCVNKNTQPLFNRWGNFCLAVKQMKPEQLCIEELTSYLGCLHLLRQDMDEMAEKVKKPFKVELRNAISDLERIQLEIESMLEYAPVQSSRERAQRTFLLESLLQALP